MTNLEQMTRLVREIEGLKARLERAEAMRPQYEILSESTILDISSDQNNYALPDFDCVFLRPLGASRTINGMMGGLKGRHLFIRNQSPLNLLFSHQNAAADADNRIATPSLATVTIASFRCAEFVYVTDADLATGANRWLMLFPAS